MTSLQEILDIAIPVIVFFLTVLVGMDLTSDHFLNLRKSQKAIWGGTLGQYCLPLCSLVILKVLDSDPEVKAGLVLISASPGGGISNYFTYVARANTALSVVLTIISSILAVVAMPLVLRTFEMMFGQQMDFHVPLGLLFGQLVLLLIVPVLLGFLIRRYRPEFVARFNKPLRLIGLAALAWLIGFVIYETRLFFLQTWRLISLSAFCYISFSMILGYLFGLLLKLNRKDSFTLVIEFGVRNIAISTAIAVVLLRRTEFATFGAIFFLIESAMILASIAIFSRMER
jgi:BASS family bile acid:Na+ symporter